jgi:hypothetical protein
MKNANNNFQDYTGTENWYRHFTGLLFTDGVRAVAETYQAYWLIDLVFSHQLSPAVKAEEFQKWVLSRKNGNAFEATCDDGNGHIVARQAIPFSDFEADTLTLYFTNRVLMLPSEY